MPQRIKAVAEVKYYFLMDTLKNTVALKAFLIIYYFVNVVRKTNLSDSFLF